MYHERKVLFIYHEVLLVLRYGLAGTWQLAVAHDASRLQRTFAPLPNRQKCSPRAIYGLYGIRKCVN